METETILSSIEWINAGGLFLLLFGVSFLIVEFFVPSFGLFGFAGMAAILIGVIQLHQTGYIDEMPISVNGLMGLATLGAVLSLIGGWYSYKLYKKKNTTGIEAMIGEKAEVIDWKDKTGHVRIQGEEWQAFADEALPLIKGTQVIVAKVEGLKIKIIIPH